MGMQEAWVVLKITHPHGSGNREKSDQRTVNGYRIERFKGFKDSSQV